MRASAAPRFWYQPSSVLVCRWKCAEPAVLLQSLGQNRITILRARTQLSFHPKVARCANTADLSESRDACRGGQAENDKARTHRGTTPGLHKTGRTPCGVMPERTMPS